MAHIEIISVQEYDDAFVNSIKLLEEHTILINRLYESGFADFDEAIHLQHLNKRLSRKLRSASRATPPSFARQAA